MKQNFLFLLALLFAPIACGQADNVAQLSSGISVRIISVGNAYSTVDESYFLMIRYETEIDIDDVQSLRTEAQEVWKVFKPTAVSSGLGFTIIQANTPRPDDSPIAYTTDTYTHVIEKREDGSWFFIADEEAV